MPTETKQELIRKIEELGESASSSMTVMQLKALLSELKTSAKESDRFALQTKLQALNKASKKKATLQALADDMNVSYTASNTIPQIYAKVEEKVSMEHPGNPWDKVNFGKHALERVKAELEQLKSENAQLTRQAERSKSRKEM